MISFALSLITGLWVDNTSVPCAIDASSHDRLGAYLPPWWLNLALTLGPLQGGGRECGPLLHLTTHPDRKARQLQRSKEKIS
jgi:hypothetical protein